MRKRKKNRIYSKQVLHLTSTPLFSKIRSAGILNIWQKETTSSHIRTAIKFEYFDLTKIRFFLKFPDFSLIFSKISNSLIFPCREFFFTIFPVFPVFQSAWPPCAAYASKRISSLKCIIQSNFNGSNPIWDHEN